MESTLLRSPLLFYFWSLGTEGLSQMLPHHSVSCRQDRHSLSWDWQMYINFQPGLDSLNVWHNVGEHLQKETRGRGACSDTVFPKAPCTWTLVGGTICEACWRKDAISGSWWRLLALSTAYDQSDSCPCFLPCLPKHDCLIPLESQTMFYVALVMAFDHSNRKNN